MKKIAATLTIALILSVFSTAVTAAGPGNGRNYVDADGNGVCDNAGSNGNGCGRRSGCGKGYVDADGNGICDNADSNGNGCGKGYADTDGDGVCDNAGSNGNGCGKGYADADGNGVCDNAEYAIKYNLNGGKNNKKNPSSYSNTSKTIKLKNPVKKGYTFKGWYADKQYWKKITAIKKGSSGQKTLYAKWKKK